MRDKLLTAFENKIKKLVGYYYKEMEINYDLFDYKVEVIDTLASENAWAFVQTWRRRIAFDWRLIALDDKSIDYVVIHELAHVKDRQYTIYELTQKTIERHKLGLPYVYTPPAPREDDHDQKFWDIVSQYCPNYKELEVKFYNQESDVKRFLS
jgi:predicted metal-dependent hydrolase